MSIISQARLTSLSHKCLLRMAWRQQDIREATLHNFSHTSCQLQAMPRSEPITSTRPLCVMRQENSSPSCIEFNTPKLHIQRLKTISDHRVLFSNCISHGVDLTSRRVTTFQNWSLSSINQSHDGKENSDHTKGSTKHKKKKNTIFSLIGLAGLFKGLTTGDIEEEREKLSDEQKVKKMNPMELYIAKGVLSMCDQNYVKANELFHEALHLAQEEKNEEQEIMILNLLASNYFESGDLDKAEKLFIELIKRMILHGLESTNIAILELSLKLASIYSKNQATHDKATQGFKFVINNLLNDLQDLLSSADVDEIDIHEISDERKDELALLGWGFDWFAKHLLNMNDYTGAALMLQRALQISSKVLGPLHDQTLILLNDLGTTMAMNEAPEEGRTYIKKAVEGAIESQSKELPSFYVNLGLVNLKLRKLNEAKRYCEYSIELASKNREHHNSYDVIQLSRSCLSEVERLLEVENQ